jgi:hypothetical protein
LPANATGRDELHRIDDARRGLADITAGRSYKADAAIAQLQQRRAGATTAGARRFTGGPAATTGKVGKQRG